MRRFLLLSAVLVVVANLVTLTAAQAQTCSASSKCPSSSPCCSAAGTCGSGAMFCAGGCNPMASNTASSCLANPVCSNKNITFAPSDYKNAHMFRPVLMYNGNSSVAPFVLEYGFLGAGPEGVLLELTAPTQTKIVSTDYVLYGNIQLTARHNARQGLVFAFITMSDIKDEIDNEQTTANGGNVYVNFFHQGQSVSGSSATVSGGKGFDVSDWHTYGINWQPDRLQWLIDGQTVHTVTSASQGNNYPRSPSQVQIAVWAGGNSTNPPGVVDWSGGAIDWSSPEYTSKGFYSAELKSYSITCGSQNVNGVNTVGNGTTPTSWIYTGKTSTTLNGPEFVLSSDPIKVLGDPSADGHANLPGFSSQSAFSQSNQNSWDGSGSTSGLSAAEISGKSGSSGGWLMGNKTLSIVVPVVAAVVVLILLWALVTFCMRKRRRARERSGITNNAFGSRDDSTQYNIGSKAADAMGAFGAKNRASSYSKLEDNDNESLAPIGAQKIGAGYGPAVGPSPGPLNQRAFADSTSSLHDPRGYSDGSNGAGETYEAYALDDRARSPAPSPYPSTGVRGPYTPAMNAYTPAMSQTPAMRGFNTSANAPIPTMRGYATQQGQQAPMQGYAMPAYSQQPSRPLPRPGLPPPAPGFPQAQPGYRPGPPQGQYRQPQYAPRPQYYSQQPHNGPYRPY